MLGLILCPESYRWSDDEIQTFLKPPPHTQPNPKLPPSYSSFLKQACYLESQTGTETGRDYFSWVATPFPSYQHEAFLLWKEDVVTGQGPGDTHTDAFGWWRFFCQLQIFVMIQSQQTFCVPGCSFVLTHRGIVVRPRRAWTRKCFAFKIFDSEDYFDAGFIKVTVLKILTSETSSLLITSWFLEFS